MLLAVLPALLAGPAAGATEQERLECLGRIRRDFGSCMREAQTRCRQQFEARLGGCFGGPECPQACLAAERTCSKQPLLERDGCRLACQADARVEQRGCRIEVDREACRRTVRVKAIKCREQCNRRAGPAVLRCREQFSECLRTCAARP
ncbi:MAG TPA: hypothetical protein VNO26_17150 [Candidatus Limnocylindria bacterium]|nr:hypothetical protein [Candidatus Limnocylindria bacterium]